MCAKGRAGDDSRSLTRTRLARALADVVAESLAMGDVHAARIGLEALERLVGVAGQCSDVADLLDDRRRGGGAT
jgi:hypothetical protein